MESILYLAVLIHLTLASDRVLTRSNVLITFNKYKWKVPSKHDPRRNKKLQLNVTNSHDDSLLHIASMYVSSPKSYHFDRIMFDDVNYKPENHMISGGPYEKKSCIQKPNLNICKGKAQLTNCMHTRNSLRTLINDEEKISNPDVEEKSNPFGNLHRDISLVRQSAIHTLKDLIKNHILNQPKNLSKDEQSNMVINTPENVIQNGDLQNEPFKCTSVLESGSYIPISHDITLKIERPSLKNIEKSFDFQEKPNKHFSNITNQEINEKFTNNHIPMIKETKSVLSNSEITKRQDIEKNAHNQNFKEIMIIEIPIKSPMKDKNILLDLNELKNMQLSRNTWKLNSEENTRNQNDMINEIERRIENKMITHLEKFKCDIVAALVDILDKKYGDKTLSKSDDDCSTKSKPRKAKHDTTITDNTKEKYDDSKEYTTECLNNITPIPKSNSSKSNSYTSKFEENMEECTTTQEQNYSSGRAEVIKNETEDCSTTEQSTSNTTGTNRKLTQSKSCFCVCGQTAFVLNSNLTNCEPKCLIALLDIDFKQPSQLCLVPKDFLQKLKKLNMNASEVQNMGDILPLTHLKPKRDDRSSDLLKDLQVMKIHLRSPSQRLTMNASEVINMGDILPFVHLKPKKDNRPEVLMKDIQVMKIQLRSPSRKFKSRMHTRQRNRTNTSTSNFYRISSPRSKPLELILQEKNDAKENWMDVL